MELHVIGGISYVWCAWRDEGCECVGVWGVSVWDVGCECVGCECVGCECGV